MSKRTMLLCAVCICVVSIICSGCSLTGSSSARKKKEPYHDPAFATLARASELVHDEMMTTSLLMRGGKTPPQQALLPHDYDLIVPIEFNWVGPAWPAIEQIAATINYKARLNGPRPLTETTVVVEATTDKNSSVYDILNDINWQLRESNGQIFIDSINKYLTLNYVRNK